MPQTQCSQRIYVAICDKKGASERWQPGQSRDPSFLRNAVHDVLPNSQNCYKNKRADMLLWHQAVVSDKGIACDTCVWNDFTLARLHLSAATAGYALLAAEKYKMDKYVALCLAAMRQPRLPPICCQPARWLWTCAAQGAPTGMGRKERGRAEDGRAGTRN